MRQILSFFGFFSLLALAASPTPLLSLFFLVFLDLVLDSLVQFFQFLLVCIASTHSLVRQPFLEVPVLEGFDTCHQFHVLRDVLFVLVIIIRNVQNTVFYGRNFVCAAISVSLIRWEIRITVSVLAFVLLDTLYLGFVDSS